MTRIFFTCLLLLLIVMESYPQTDTPQFGIFTEAERKLSSCDFDKGASIITLLDEGEAYHNFQNNYTTYRRIRLKILKESGLQAANVEVPYFSNDDYEYVNEIEAISYSPDEFGVYKTTKLTTKDFLREKIDDMHSVVKIPFPNVKPGSIIEYKYKSFIKGYNGSTDWYFQSQYPTLKSVYILHYAKTGLFSYQLFKKAGLDILEKDDQFNTTYVFEMKELPGLEIEPFMEAPRDCLQRIQFQLGSFRDFFQKTYDIPTNWDEFSTRYLDYKNLHKQLQKRINGSELKIRQLKNLSSADEQIKELYHFMQGDFGLNPISTKYIQSDLDDIWSTKRGTRAELNLLLVNLLIQLGIEAYPVLTSSRDFGMINPKQLFSGQFNRVVVLVEINSMRYILDVGSRFTPVKLIPPEVFGNYALILKKKGSGFIRLQGENNLYFNSYNTITNLENQGNTIKKITHIAKSISAIELRQLGQSNSKSVSKEITVTADSLNILSNDSGISSSQVSFWKTDTANQSGEYTFVNPWKMSGFLVNPFTKQSRFSNINFGAKRYLEIVDTIYYSDRYKLVTPTVKETIFKLDSSIVVNREISVENGKVVCKFSLSIKRSIYTPEEYLVIQSIFREIERFPKESIVFKHPASVSSEN